MALRWSSPSLIPPLQIVRNVENQFGRFIPMLASSSRDLVSTRRIQEVNLNLLQVQQLQLPPHLQRLRANQRARRNLKKRVLLVNSYRDVADDRL